MTTSSCKVLAVLLVESCLKYSTQYYNIKLNWNINWMIKAGRQVSGTV